MGHPHSYDWHDGNTRHHASLLVKHDGPPQPPGAQPQGHPHMDAPPKTLAQDNDQFASKGVSTYGDIAKHFGTITPTKSDLFHYDYRGKLPQVQDLVKQHGYQVYYAGNQFGKPDLAAKNYNTKHLMIYDPTPSSGGDFGDRDYTDAWRQTHELAHALAYPGLNQIYGEGRRIGKLGVQRTPHEAKRAVHWEWLAAHQQRDLNKRLGIHVPDDVFHKELNTVMHDAVHRAITGKFTDPAEEGFVPHSHKVPLETSLGMIDQASARMGLTHSHALLRKTENLAAMVDPRHEILHSWYKELKEIQELKKSYERLEKPNAVERLRKSAAAIEKCQKCGEIHTDKMAKCGDIVKKDEESMKPLKDRKTVPMSGALPDEPKDGTILPTDKKPKDLSDKDTGAGGQVQKIRKNAMAMGASPMGMQMSAPPMDMQKGDVPMAKPPGGGSAMKPPTSKPTAAGAPMGKAEEPLVKDLPGMSKPRLGGKDGASQAMTADAGAAAKPSALGAPPAAPKAPVDHAARQSQYADFTPAGAFQTSPGGAAAGSLKAFRKSATSR